MTGMEPGRTRFEFGEFALDVGRATLVRGNREIRLRPKSFEVLRHLVEHAGVVVERRSLMDAVWGSTVVTEDSLTQCIVEVRRALGDRSQQVLRTVPRRGFILDVDVRTPCGAPAAPQLMSATAQEREPVSPPIAAAATPSIVEPRRAAVPGAGRGIAMLGMVLLGVAAGGWWWWNRVSPAQDAVASVGPGEAAASVPAHDRSIAVLRFLDLSAGGDQAYFADGLAEEILHLLAQSPELRVSARSSSFMFGAAEADIAAVAAQLGVQHVLEGSVRREGDDVRVTVQLIDGATQSHVWSRTYDRTFGRVLELQSEIASDVAAALQVTLSRAPYSTAPSAAEAQEAYLFGLHLFHRRGPGDLAAAERQFERAVELDPLHARAWTSLAGTYSVRGLDELRDPTYRLEEQRQALEQALAIDPNLAEAYVRLARYYGVKGQRAERTAAFERARELAPNDGLVLASRVNRALREGRIDEAVELHRRIVATDPLSALYRRNLAVLLLGAGQYDEALAELQRAQSLSPAADDLQDAIVLAHLLGGDRAQAEALLRRQAASPRRDELLVLLSGPGAEAARQRLESDASALGRLRLAELAAYRGDIESAFARLGELQRAQPADGMERDDLYHDALISPLLRPLHGDPRWAELLAALSEP